MALTDTAIRKAAPKEKSYMIRDDRGLYIEIKPNGNKFWRLRYWVAGKEKKKALGRYPVVSLADARRQRDLFKNYTPESVTFKTLAEEWLQIKVIPIRTPRHTETIISRLKRLVFPYIGERAIEDISAPDVLALLRKIEARGAHETAHRTMQICGQVFRYGIATGRADRDVAADLRGALMPVRSKHHATITDPDEIGGLMRAIESLPQTQVRCAMKLQAYTFVRPGELRHAEWEEFDLEKAEWKIAAEKMKMRRAHIIPLARQSIEIIKKMEALTGGEKYVFPSIRTRERPMSENTITAAIRRLGYTKEQMTGHGFRAMASTILNEHGWEPDVIERQLAHVEKNAVRAAYNHAEYLPERRKMMQWWVNYLENLRVK